MRIHESLMSIAGGFDAFLFDAYGVIWSGREFYPGSRELMKALRRAGKAVYVLSNTARIASDTIASYEKKGLAKGEHYDGLITSGEAARKLLLDGRLEFSGNKNPAKFHVFGISDIKLFADTKYKAVEDAKSADFFYISAPQLTDAEKDAMPQYAQYLYESKASKEGGPRLWDSTNEEAFAPKLEAYRKLGLPAFNANPDMRAAESDRRENASRFVVRQGTIAEMYRKMGGEVVETGKPHKAIYDFALDTLAADGAATDKSRILMIGDTVRTDILGANNAGIKSALTVETGVTAEAIARGALLDDIIAEGKGAPDYLIKAVAQAI
jgi:HAD superfamily hydrolase (TIGR01450 family)